ncbi:MAG: membrane dipeptidase [Parvibaculaceae bacterium]
MVNSTRRGEIDPEILSLHRRTLVFDCLALNYVLDEPYLTRMRDGGVDVINVTIASEESWDETLRTTEECLGKIAGNPQLVQAVRSQDITAAKSGGKIAVILGTQGASMLETSLWRLELLHRLGFRYFGPAYTGATVFADGCGEFRDAGLSVLGRELIELANELGIIVDMSHCGHRSRLEIAGLAKFPVCTHSNSYTVNPNDRNTRDEVVRLVAQKGGVMGICGLVKSVWPEHATLEHMLDHLDHYVKLVGHEHVGLGLDFTEAYQEAYRAGNRNLAVVPKWRRLRPDIFGTSEEFFTLSYPAGLESIALLPGFTQGMKDRGYDEAAIAAVLGGNWLRHFKAANG